MRLLLKSMDQTRFGVSGTASSSGFSRANLRRGLTRRVSSNTQQVRWTRLWFQTCPLTSRKLDTNTG